MVSLVARQGRELQRYSEHGHRLVVGCIPYKLEADKTGADAIAIDQALQVLVISAQKGQEMLFPRGGWESDESEEEATSREAMEEAGVLGNVEKELGRWWYQSKSHESRKMGIMFPLNVTEELHQWPEMGNRRRRWVTVAEARETCQQVWMLEALSILVHRLSSVLTVHTASPPRTLVGQPGERLETLKRGRIVLSKELESPVVRKKKPRQFDSILSLAEGILVIDCINNGRRFCGIILSIMSLAEGILVIDCINNGRRFCEIILSILLLVIVRLPPSILVPKAGGNGCRKPLVAGNPWLPSGKDVNGRLCF